MAKGGRVGYKRKARNNVRLEKQGSDDSDEDYKVDEDEFNQSEDEYCSSLAEYESNESLGEFEEEEEEWVEKKVKKVTRPRGRKNFQQRKKKGVVKRRKKKVSYKEEDDEEEAEEDYDDDDDDFADVNQRKKNGIMKPRRKKVSHNKEEDDGDDDEEEEEEEEDYDDDEEEEEEEEDYDDDDDDFADVNHRKNNGILKPRRKNVSYKEEDEEKGDYDDDDDDDDDVNHRKTNGIVKPRRKMISYKEEEEEEEEEEDYDDDDFADVNHRKKIKVSHKEEEDDNVEILHKQEEDDLVDEKQGETGIKKNNASYQEGKEDGNSDDLADEDDEEFTPTEVWKATRRRKPVEKQVTRRNMRSSLSKEFRDENPTSRKRRTTRGRRRKTVVNSESDFVSSESDFEFTISEEEREQVIEASEFCRRLTTSLRSSTSSMMIKEEEFPPQRKCQARKGKEKVVNMKIELVKQVCGICLSEEGKRTVKGVLNCCSHYFCFACIMEWSKVESRCPLCKQRFTTINRTTRVNGGNDLGGAVFPVPERDQVYQPSEEELRGFLDPYESVLCTECQQGGDDAFMLLCDLCDSPAHTYCVGLGREVPDGNWYCDGCRPTLALSNGQTLNPTHDHGASHSLSFGSSPVSAVRETFDLNEVYVPDTPLAEQSQSPRNYAGDFQGASQGSGFGALTLHDRRRIQRQIHQILNTRSRQSERSDDVGSLSGINLFGSPIGRGGVIAPQPDVVPARIAPQNIYVNGRIQEYNTHSELNPRLSLREQALHNQASTSTNHSFGGLVNDEFGGINPRVGEDFSNQQLQPCSGISNTESETSTLPYQFREATVPSRTLQGSLHAPF